MQRPSKTQRWSSWSYLTVASTAGTRLARHDARSSINLAVDRGVPPLPPCARHVCQPLDSTYMYVFKAMAARGADHVAWCITPQMDAHGEVTAMPQLLRCTSVRPSKQVAWPTCSDVQLLSLSTTRTTPRRQRDLPHSWPQPLSCLLIEKRNGGREGRRRGGRTRPRLARRR